MGYLYTAVVIAVSVAIKNILEARWERFKEREALKPQQMVLKNGVYVPWGPVQKVQRIFRTGMILWAIYMLILIGWGIHLAIG